MYLINSICLQEIFWQSSETDQNLIQCILNDICNDPVDLDPFLKIANIFLVTIIKQKNKKSLNLVT